MLRNTSLAAFPGFSFVGSAQRVFALADGTEELQICPQNHGVLDKKVVNDLQGIGFTKMRPHANVRLDWRGPRVVDASTPWSVSKSYFQKLADLSSTMGATAYSLHAGRNTENGGCSLGTMLDNVARVRDVLDLPVAVEGLYPAKGSPFLMATWEEYEAVLRDGETPMAIDLSHLNILTRRSGSRDDLVAELLAYPQTLEVHISGNDGRADSHALCDGQEFWWPLMEHVNPTAVIFDEGTRSTPEREKRTTNVYA
ncbi:hypothetical protein HAP94_18255 [Acidithiobacillus ferrivorans]|nr:hypothetical protein [Acidithiobacillus ferrivorans]